MLAKNKGQIALEYLIVIGLALSMLIPTFYIFYQQSANINDQVAAEKVDALGTEALKQARLIYYTGKHAQTTIEFDMPETVVNFSVRSEKELVITLFVAGQKQEMVYFADDFNITAGGNCITPKGYINTSNFYSAGTKILMVESCGNKTIFRVPK